MSTRREVLEIGAERGVGVAASAGVKIPNEVLSCFEHEKVMNIKKSVFAIYAKGE